jgi:hypothetical protein
MPAEIFRSDPSEIPTTLKEALVDALVNMTYAYVSGAGDIGKYLYGARPRTLLNSGFLLPEMDSGPGDEVTSPIWISSHGIQLQVASGTPGTICVTPMLSVYVRVLPREEDLKRANCRASFRLRDAVRDEVRAAIRTRLSAEWDKLKAQFKSRYKCPQWESIRKAIQEEIHSAHGIPKDLVVLDGDEEPRRENESNESAEGDADEGIVVGAATTVAINDLHFEDLSVPHKWQRLDISLPPLSFDPSLGAAVTQMAAEAHAVVMNRTIAEFLDAWSKDEDPQTGGKLWGYRSRLKIRPSQYHHWQTFLDGARQSELPCPRSRSAGICRLGRIGWIPPNSTF